MMNTRIQGSRFKTKDSGSSPCILHPASCTSKESGFTLVEMIMVIVITGIIGGMVAIFLKTPVEQYMDIARRADMTDIADTALRRIGRDLRLALPNSVRVTGTCGGAATCYIEFLPTRDGGRYRVDPGTGTLCAAVAGNSGGDSLSFDTADTCFEVLGPMPSAAAGDSVVVYNMTSNPLDTNPNAYAGGNRAAYGSTAGAVMKITSKLFPFDSPGHRFQVISTPVTYVCAPATTGVDGTGTLIRYWGYPIQSAQPTALGTLTSVNPGAVLANRVSSCDFSYNAFVVAQRSGLVTMNLGITENNETVTLYSATHVSNVP
jgi:MSHA biogenesis protein MshO